MSGFVRWSRFAFNAVAWLFVVCVGIQVYLAGLGVFAGNSFDTHRGFGYTFGLLTLVLLGLAIVGRLPRRWIGASTGLLGLFFLQSVFVAFKDTVPAFAALHPVNGMLIGLVAVVVAWQTRGYLRAPRPAAIQGSASEPETKPA